MDLSSVATLAAVFFSHFIIMHFHFLRLKSIEGLLFALLDEHALLLSIVRIHSAMHDAFVQSKNCLPFLFICFFLDQHFSFPFSSFLSVNDRKRNPKPLNRISLEPPPSPHISYVHTHYFWMMRSMNDCAINLFSFHLIIFSCFLFWSAFSLKLLFSICSLFSLNISDKFRIIRILRFEYVFFFFDSFLNIFFTLVFFWLNMNWKSWAKISNGEKIKRNKMKWELIRPTNHLI